MKSMKDLLMDAPIIAAVKDTAGLQRALESDCRVIFLLFGTLVNSNSLVFAEGLERRLGLFLNPVFHMLRIY